MLFINRYTYFSDYHLVIFTHGSVSNPIQKLFYKNILKYVCTIYFLSCLAKLPLNTLYLFLYVDTESEKEHEGWQRLLDRNVTDIDEDEEDVIFETTPVTHL